MSRTTIAIQTQTRARLREQADDESMTIDAFLQELLDERERSRFWASFEDVTPQVYAAAVARDGDGLDESYTVENGILTAEEAS